MNDRLCSEWRKGRSHSATPLPGGCRTEPEGCERARGNTRNAPRQKQDGGVKLNWEQRSNVAFFQIRTVFCGFVPSWLWYCASVDRSQVLEMNVLDPIPLWRLLVCQYKETNDTLKRKRTALDRIAMAGFTFQHHGQRQRNSTFPGSQMMCFFGGFY